MYPTDEEMKLSYLLKINEATIMQIEMEHNFNVRVKRHAPIDEVKETTCSNDEL